MRRASFVTGTSSARAFDVGPQFLRGQAPFLCGATGLRGLAHPEPNACPPDELHQSDSCRFPIHSLRAVLTTVEGEDAVDGDAAAGQRDQPDFDIRW